MIKSKRYALAIHLMMYFSDTEHYRYHQGRTSQPVWAFDDVYYCATKKDQKPAKHRDGIGWRSLMSL